MIYAEARAKPDSDSRKLRPVPDAPVDISTDTDRQTQAVILRHIHQAFPNDALCAERRLMMLATNGVLHEAALAALRA
jgi:fructose-1,6-bisphosphatase/inositol monophosphatase family enzyme